MYRAEQALENNSCSYADNEIAPCNDRKPISRPLKPTPSHKSVRCDVQMSGYGHLFASMALLIVASAATHAQTVREAYDPSRTFARLTLPQAVNRYRSADGAPGPDYWQNRADYEIHARLDTLAHRLQGSEVITYTNNSPGRARQPVAAARSEHVSAAIRAPPTAAARGARNPRTGMELESVEVTPRAADVARPTTSSPIRACRSGWRGRSPPGGKLQLRDSLPLHGSRRVRRPHRLQRHPQWRDLRHRAMVSAHGGV